MACFFARKALREQLQQIQEDKASDLKKRESAKQAGLKEKEEAKQAALKEQEEAKQAALKKEKEEAKQAALKKQEEEAKQAALKKEQEEAKQAALKKEKEAAKQAALKKEKEEAKQAALKKEKEEAKQAALKKQEEEAKQAALKKEQEEAKQAALMENEAEQSLPKEVQEEDTEPDSSNKSDQEEDESDQEEDESDQEESEEEENTLPSGNERAAKEEAPENEDEVEDELDEATPAGAALTDEEALQKVVKLKKYQSFTCAKPSSPWAKYIGNHHYRFTKRNGVKKHVIIRLLEENGRPKLYLIEVPSAVKLATTRSFTRRVEDLTAIKIDQITIEPQKKEPAAVTLYMYFEHTLLGQHGGFYTIINAGLAEGVTGMAMRRVFKWEHHSFIPLAISVPASEGDKIVNMLKDTGIRSMLPAWVEPTYSQVLKEEACALGKTVAKKTVSAVTGGLI